VAREQGPSQQGLRGGYQRGSTRFANDRTRTQAHKPADSGVVAGNGKRRSSPGMGNRWAIQALTRMGPERTALSSRKWWLRAASRAVRLKGCLKGK
jgi:hypothetical protein